VGRQIEARRVANILPQTKMPQFYYMPTEISLETRGSKVFTSTSTRWKKKVSCSCMIWGTFGIFRILGIFRIFGLLCTGQENWFEVNWWKVNKEIGGIPKREVCRGSGLLHGQS